MRVLNYIMSRSNPIYFSKILSAGELRSEFSRSPCCNKNCCVSILNMPLDASFPLNWSTSFCGEIIPLQQKEMSDAICEFENFVITLRSATSKFRRGTKESDDMLSQYLRDRFAEKHKKLDKGNYEWIYDLVHPIKGNIEVCRRAWIGCFGVSWQKVRFAQECVKGGNFLSSKVVPAADIITLNDAFERFGLELNDYLGSFDNFMDISKVSETQGSLIATAWLSREFDSTGEAQPDEKVILIDYVEEKDVYERFKNDKDLKSINTEYVSYSEFNRIWREVFPKVGL